ncbi:DUF2871 family protein [Arsenicicoccus sp. oral taxon 190]|uniref:DUF2871 family protein n=1 Tax=Arsenicicoccus sp. oral taxon 190 TaxID=1658671 RepID=UPI000679EDFF|nr:DUF2871 family protein [Arsenicicoccus sp. oral taxon 190]AKT50843.1 hypothetical protein ADJ73_05150 [Arsenicicoccus sp. oral taxon 190]
MTNAPSQPDHRPAALTPIYWAVVAYTTLGLASGLYYREFTKAHDFHGVTQLAFVHTHLLALGTLLGLILLLLERGFGLSRTAQWMPMWITYNAGLVITATMLTVKGTLQVLGSSSATSPALAGIAGLGHILLTLALVFLLVALKKRLPA